jgi:ribosomal protein S18 acetylase RimI-like enzyme
MIEYRVCSQQDQAGVVDLWRLVFPDAPLHNNPRNDIRIKGKVQPELFFVASQEGKIVGTAMSGFDGHRGWVYYVAVHPDFRRMGIGSALMRTVEIALGAAGCPKLNLQIRANNHAVQSFYQSLGYDVEDRLSMGKKLTPNQED